MDINGLKILYHQYGELLLHLVLLLFYFTALNVRWTEDWTAWTLQQGGIRPVSALVFPLVFYLNAFWLVPNYLKKQRWLWYALMTGMLALSIEVFRTLLFVYLDPKVSLSQEFLNYKHVFDAVINGFMLSFAYVLAKDWLVNQGLIKRLKAEKLEAELAFLKSQVDPHLLFNTLNNLYSLALEEDSPQTADGISKLGKLMRYNLHDSNADFIPLEREVQYIQNYIELQRLRTTEGNEINLNIEISEAQDDRAEIAPMLLIPFVENAFKYGISPTEKTFIHIAIELAGQVLKMQIKNSIIRNVNEHTVGGVGLKNVKKRLELLYSERHQLICEKQADTYFVSLEIKLHP